MCIRYLWFIVYYFDSPPTRLEKLRKLNIKKTCQNDRTRGGYYGVEGDKGTIKTGYKDAWYETGGIGGQDWN